MSQSGSTPTGSAAQPSCQAATTPEQVRRDALADEVRAGTAIPDHIVSFDGFEHEVYVDRGFTPPVVIVAQSDASTDRMLSLPSIRKQKHLIVKLHAMAKNYERAMRGEAQEPVPDSPPAATDEEGEPVEIASILDCVQYYSREIPRWNQMTDTNVVILDDAGRPLQTYFHASWLANTAPRQPKCQSQVASWGIAGQDQGGHGIGARLGGWGGRANLFPQDAVLNNDTEWKSLDAAADLCSGRGFLTAHFVTPEYYTLQVRPHTFDIITGVTSKTCPPTNLARENTRVGNYPPTASDRTNMQLHSNAIKRACKV